MLMRRRQSPPHVVWYKRACGPLIPLLLLLLLLLLGIANGSPSRLRRRTGEKILMRPYCFEEKKARSGH